MFCQMHVGFVSMLLWIIYHDNRAQTNSLHMTTHSRLTERKKNNQEYKTFKTLFFIAKALFLTLAWTETLPVASPCSVFLFYQWYRKYDWKDFQHQLNIQFITLCQCRNVFVQTRYMYFIVMIFSGLKQWETEIVPDLICQLIVRGAVPD